MGGGGEGINPIGRGHGCLEQESANDVVGGADNALGFAILLRGVWARHAKRNTMGKEESTRGGIIKFATVITLDGFNSAPELRLHKSKEIRKNGKGVRL
jgi:hypothetical protein